MQTWAHTDRWATRRYMHFLHLTPKDTFHLVTRKPGIQRYLFRVLVVTCNKWFFPPIRNQNLMIHPGASESQHGWMSPTQTQVHLTPNNKHSSSYEATLQNQPPPPTSNTVSRPYDRGVSRLEPTRSLKRLPNQLDCVKLCIKYLLGLDTYVVSRLPSFMEQSFSTPKDGVPCGDNKLVPPYSMRHHLQKKKNHIWHEAQTLFI